MGAPMEMNDILLTSSGLFPFMPAAISALYATRSGRIPLLFISLNKSNAASHCPELPHATNV